MAKASNKAKAPTTATATATATATVSEKALAVVRAAIAGTAQAESGVDQANLARGQKWLICADAIVAAGFRDKTDAREQLEKPFVEAFAKIGKDEKYALEIRSKILALAFPANAEAKAQAIKDKKPVSIILGASRNSLKRDKSGNWKIQKSDKRGGKNKAKPQDVYTKAVDSAITAASTAKMSLEQVLVPIVSAILACELADDVEEIRKSPALRD